MSILTPAQSIEELDFETILQEQKDYLIALDPALEEVLNIESEALTKMIENFAYRELHLRARVNAGITATFVSTATGSDLDHLLLWLGVERLTITPADDTTTPPTPAVMEEDEDLRRRGLLVLESFSTAGPRLGYHYHGLSVVGVHDIYASSPSNGVVDIKVMGESGIADDELIAQVTEKLSDETIRPLGTQLNVSSATQVDYEVLATLELNDTPESALAKENATTSLNEYINSRFNIGADIHISSIYAVLQQPGVESVNLTAPANNIIISSDEFAKCTSIIIT